MREETLFESSDGTIEKQSVSQPACVGLSRI